MCCIPYRKIDDIDDDLNIMDLIKLKRLIDSELVSMEYLHKVSPEFMSCDEMIGMKKLRIKIMSKIKSLELV